MSHHVPTISARRRVIISIICGVLAAVVSGISGHPYLAALIGWDVTALTFMIGLWTHIWDMDEKATAEHALLEDPTRATAYTVLLSASLASLAAVVVILAKASHATGAEEVMFALLGIGSVVVSWLIVHSLYTLRYAVLYFTPPEGGVSFNDDIRPTYSDFAYLAFTLGMTYQVSDTSFGTRKFRRVAISHALFSYLFGTAIVAATINLLAGLGR
jgi:uncharacterized membrane protein